MPPKKTEALEGIQEFLLKFLKHRLIQPCQSPYNSILPIKKPHTNIDLYKKKYIIKFTNTSFISNFIVHKYPHFAN